MMYDKMVCRINPKGSRQGKQGKLPLKPHLRDLRMVERVSKASWEESYPPARALKVKKYSPIKQQITGKDRKVAAYLR